MSGFSGKIQWIAYYNETDGYGRFNSRLISALQSFGVEVKTATEAHLYMPSWMQRQEGLYWQNLTISSLPPYLVRPVPGRHWVITMLEGSVAPEDWVVQLNESGAERIFVPCIHNKEAYENSGVTIPISILPGGTDPNEFYLIEEQEPRPYNFMTFADRGFRKGVEEVYNAFYLAFGGKTTGHQDVTLAFKYLPRKGGTLLDFVRKAEDLDKRLLFWNESAPRMQSLYSKANCLVLPSRSEGWGMPHREAAMMGLPVITQKCSGLDDGHLEEWALVLEGSQLKPIPKENRINLGEWMIADKYKLAEKMYWCYEHWQEAKEFGQQARQWLSTFQTWRHSASILLEHLESV